ncbi:MAG: M1 family metallopeptidase [Candidatus Marsarchaeota archaeon]|nr:M1 family metallopeptidase [Candidatus Marsarchaeota archaeon]
MDERHKTIGSNTIPESYRLTFDTDMKRFTYIGKAAITVSVRKPTRKIVLNAKELGIKSAKVRCSGRTQGASVRLSKSDETLTLGLAESIHGKAVIEIEFSGRNNDGMYGFYRSAYDAGKRKEYMLSTQFEPADARAAFPCFDEPEFKARFYITIVADKGYEALSNMPVRSKTSSNGRTITTFMATPRMSTYLVYLDVGRFDRISTKLGRLSISVLSVPGKKALCGMALKYARGFIAFYERYFRIRYPLPKVDLIAIPDFSAGAMENWGAITFRETALLGDERGTPIAVKQRIAETVAHELAHQWFGDLVTMKWWNDLWLNESFATFMSYKAMQAVYPEWNMKEQYTNDVMAIAFAADQLRSTHPISVDVNTPEEINGIFDEISYEKGGTVLHMIEEYAGADAFRAGLHDYLRAHSYGNAVKRDLWDAIGKASGSSGIGSVPKFASSWIDQPGYPMLSVERSGSKFMIEQHRFTLRGIDRASKQVWPVPIYYLSGKAKPAHAFMAGRRIAIDAADNWVKLNYGQHFLYRSAYDAWVLDRIGGMINGGKLSAIDAWGVENDLFAMMRAGEIPLSDYIGFVGRHCLNAGYPLSDNLAAHFGWLTSLLYTKDAFKLVSQVQRKYFDGIIRRLGWKTRNGEPNTDTMLRSAAIHGLGILGDEKATAWARREFDAHTKEGKQIDPNLRGAAYSIMAWNGDAGMFKKLAGMYKKAEMPDEKIRLLSSLAMFKSAPMAKRALGFSRSKDVRLQDSIHIPAVLSSNPMHVHMLASWIMKNWKELQKLYTPGAHMLDRYVEYMSMVSSRKELAAIEAFFAKRGNMRGDVKKSYRETVERIEANIRVMERNGIK